MMPDEVALRRAERKKLATEYKGLFQEISALLFRHDPIGINFEDNTDEYDPEAGTIIPRLRGAKSVADVTCIVHEEFARWFDPELAGPPSRYTEIASEILDVYRKWNASAT